MSAVLGEGVQIEWRKWEPPPYRAVEDGWQKYQKLMAGALSYDDWIKLRTAFRCVAEVTERFTRDDKVMKLDDIIPLQEAWAAIPEGIKALRSYL